jgi:hypothetical protein
MNIPFKSMTIPRLKSEICKAALPAQKKLKKWVGNPG